MMQESEKKINQTKLYLKLEFTMFLYILNIYATYFRKGEKY